MTIISTFVNKDFAVAFSDGREVSAGQVTKNDRDKTFSLYNNTVIGAFSGDYIVNKPDGSVTNFGEILAEYEQKHPDAAFSDFINDNIETFKQHLSATLPQNDKLAYLHIVRKISEPEAKFHCYRYEFHTESDGAKKIIVHKPCLDKKTNDIHSYDGDDLAVPIIKNEFKTNSPTGTKDEILAWFTKAFDKAIVGSTKTESGETTCGGKISCQFIE